MNERDAFIAAIIAEPKDDGLRLILADKLMELGEYEREELIRIQCELEEHGESNHPDFQRLGGREFSILMHAAWSDAGVCDGIDLQGQGGRGVEVVGANGVNLLWRRGFVAEVHCPLSVWIEHGPRLVREHPIEVARATDFQTVQTQEHTPASLARWETEYDTREHIISWGRNPFPGQPIEYGSLTFAQSVTFMFKLRQFMPKNYLGWSRAQSQEMMIQSDALIAWAKSQPVEVVK